MPDRHKTKPKAVRFPDGLLARAQEAAEAADMTVNAFIVAAVEEKIEDHHLDSQVDSPHDGHVRTFANGFARSNGLSPGLYEQLRTFANLVRLDF